MEISVKTLTPIWTGGVSGKVDRVHETAILGSLRWWYEALVRGLGGKACDPSEHRCIYDAAKANDGLCDVCQVFGATGYRRKFRITVKEDTISDSSIKHPIKANRKWIGLATKKWTHS